VWSVFAPAIYVWFCGAQLHAQGGEGHAAALDGHPQFDVKGRYMGVSAWKGAGKPCRTSPKVRVNAAPAGGAKGATSSVQRAAAVNEKS
jgi:hypothetical protein